MVLCNIKNKALCLAGIFIARKFFKNLQVIKDQFSVNYGKSALLIILLLTLVIFSQNKNLK